MGIFLWILIVWLLIFMGFYLVNRSISHSVLYTTAIFMIATIIFGGILYSDINDFKEKIVTEPKLFLLHDNGRVICAFEAEDIGAKMPVFFSESDLPILQTNLDQNYYSTENSEYYKAFIFDISFFEDNPPQVLEYNDLQAQGEDGIDILHSSTPRNDFVTLFSEEMLPNSTTMMGPELKQSILAQLGDKAEFKAQIFALMFSTMVQEQGPLFMIESLQDESLQVLPETITFKFIKAMPPELVKKISEYVKQ